MPLDTERRFAEIKVRCPRDFIHPIRTVYATLIYLNGQWIVTDCTGCDELNGASECDRCVMYVIQHLMNSPDDYRCEVHLPCS